jgi:meiotically up-regulated gene 157 (Mug157) protein
MVWSAFRPSDDPQTYSYSIPDNIYLAGALQRLAILNRAVWCDEAIGAAADALLGNVTEGIRRHGMVEARDEPGTRIYAYEVDGMGGVLSDFDDPNVPSLLAIPLLGWDGYDRDAYAATRRRVFSIRNPYYFKGGKLEGLGSPHTNPRYVWPLAAAVEALTTDDAPRQAALLRSMLLMNSGNGLMHESVHVDSPQLFSRAEFGWANAMLVVAVERLLGVDCDAAAEAQRLRDVKAREAGDRRVPANRGADLPEYYALLEAGIKHEV